MGLELLLLEMVLLFDTDFASNPLLNMHVLVARHRLGVVEHFEQCVLLVEVFGLGLILSQVLQSQAKPLLATPRGSCLEY